MITKTSNTIANLKNLWIEMFLNKTDKVSNIADGSVLNGVAFGTAKVAQKAIKDIAIVEAQIFPKSATGGYLDKSAALFGVSPRKQALGSSTYVRVYAQPGTLYAIGTNFISKNGIRFVVDQDYTVDSSGYGYVSVRSTITGSATNVEANSIIQVSPRPLTHIECTNEYAAIGGRDYEDDETFRNRIINYNNKLSVETKESWTQIFQDLDPRILKVMNVGLGEDGKMHIYLVTQNGSFFTDGELETLLEQATPYFGLTELNLSGESVGIVLENAKWMYVGGEEGVDFRVELSPDTDIADVRKTIQIAMTKYLDFRFWTSGKNVEWDDLLEVVKTAEGVKYVPDEYFFPYYDEEVPLNMLPRIKGFRMRDLEGNVLYDANSNLSNIFYPASDSDIYKGTQSTIISQKYLTSFTVTNLKGIPTPGAYISIGNKVIITDANGTANVLLENGEYSYILSKSNWTQQTGEFVVLNGPVYITINDFTATPYDVIFTVYEGNAPMEGATVSVGIYTKETDAEGNAKVELEPGTYSYTISKAGFKTIESVLTVENQPLEIFEKMFLETLNVSFAVIDRARGVYVPQANISVVNQSKTTNEDGQAEIGLEVGNYEVTVVKEGYQEKNQNIAVASEEPNCVVIEMAAVPYEVKFTVLDEENDNVIPGATLSIDGGTYIADENGIVIVSLPDGNFEYTIFKSGYMAYTNRIVVDGAPVSKIIRLGKAYYTLRVTVRDIDTGNFIQGAALSIGGQVGITNVNGVTSIILGNGEYPFTITSANYKKYTGNVTIKDQDIVLTVYMQIKDTNIDYIATDELTGEAIEGVNIQLVNKETGETVAQGNTNILGQLLLSAEAGEYSWTAIHKWYLSVSQDVVLEKLQDIEIPFTMKRKNINTEVDITEYIPGVSGDEESVKALGVKSVEALGNDNYYYVARIPEQILVPNTASSFDMRSLIQTFRRAVDGEINEEYDWITKGGARLDINIVSIPNPFATLDGTQIEVAENVELTRDATPRECYIDITVSTEISQQTSNINLTQRKSTRFIPIKAGLKITAKNTIDGTTKQYTTNENGAFFPEVTLLIKYEFTVTEAGFYANNGLFIMSWDFEGNFPVEMQITASKQLEFRVKQNNTFRPLEDAEIVVTGMSLDQTVTSGADGSAKVYISPLTMNYTCTFPDHNILKGTFTPPLTNDYLDLVLLYDKMTFNLTVKNTIPYNHVAESCPVTVASTWSGIPSQQYTFSGTTNANGVLRTDGNGTFNIPPGNYQITIGGSTSNFDAEIKDIYLPADASTSMIAVRRTISITATVKEILPQISSTVANPVKAGLNLTCIYNENETSSGPNVTTNASGQFTKTIYAGLPEKFQVTPVVFYDGNGVIKLDYNAPDKNPILTFTATKRIPVYAKSDQYGALQGATVVFNGMSVVQTQTSDSAGIVYMYLSPIAMSYVASKEYYDNATLSFTPTGSEMRMDITLKAQALPVTFHVATGGILPPEGIIVRIENESNDLVYEATTDVDGTAIMPSVIIGPYSYAVLAGEITTGRFLHPLTSTGSVLDVETKYELINAGVQVKEVYGDAGSAFLSDKTLTMTSKAGEITLTLDENGYINITLIKGLEYTFAVNEYQNFYSNPSQSNAWTEDGIIWEMNLNVTAQITFNVKDQYSAANLQGAVVTWNSQQVSTNASGNVVLYRSALTKDYSVDNDGYDTKQGTITPTTTSPFNITMIRATTPITLKVVETIPGVTGSFAYAGKTIKWTAGSSTGNITTDSSGNVSFSGILRTAITFSLTENADFYSNSTQSFTYTSEGQSQTMSLTCAKQLTITVKSNIPANTILPGVSLAYFGQTATSNSEGYALFYRSGLDKPLTGSVTYFNAYLGTVTAAQTSPYTITLLRTTATVTLTVNEVIGSNSYRLSSTVMSRTSTRGNADLTLSGNGQKSNTVYTGLVYTYTPKNYASYYSDATQTHTWTKEGEGWTMNMTATARVTFNVKSKNYGGNLSGVSFTMLGQTGTTDSSGNISLYRSGCAVIRTYSYSKTNYVSGSGQLAASATSPVNIILDEATSLSITITIKDVYQGAVKGNANGCPVSLTNNNLSTVTFSGTTNSNGQVSFGPMITGTYTVRWGGGTSYWAAGSATINMPTSASTYNASRLTKTIGTRFNFRIPSTGTTIKYWGSNTLMKPVFTTAGVATTITLDIYPQSGLYYLANYTFIAGIATTIVAKTANYFVTGTTSTETPYVITPTYNFSNITQTTDSTAFRSYAIKSIVVTVQDSFTNAVVSGATINMYGINGAYTGTVGNQGIQTVTTNTNGQATVYVSGLTNRYAVSASKYDALETTNTNTTNFTIKLVRSEATITFTVKREDNNSLVAANCAIKLSTNKSTINYSGTTNASGVASIVIRPGAYYYIQVGGVTNSWDIYGSSGDYPVPTTYSAVWDFNVTPSANLRAMYIGSSGWYGVIKKIEVGNDSNYVYYTGIAADHNPYFSQPSNSSAYIVHFNPLYAVYNIESLGFANNYDSSNSFCQYQYSMDGTTSRIGNIQTTLRLNVTQMNIVKSRVIYNGDLKVPIYNDIVETQGVVNVAHFTADSAIYRIVGGLFSYYYKNTDEIYSDSRGHISSNVRLNEILYESFSCLNSYSATQGITYFGKNTTMLSIPDKIGNLFLTSTYRVNQISVASDNGGGSFKSYALSIPTSSAVEDVAFYKYIKVYEDDSWLGALALGVKQNQTISDFRLIYIKFQRSLDWSQVASYTFNRTNMTNIETNLGANLWISPNQKWMFFVPKGNTTFYGYPKGLYSYYYNGNKILNVNGLVTGDQSYMNTSHTNYMRASFSSHYVQEIIFNNSETSTKAIIFVSQTDGCFGASFRNTSYIEGKNPTGVSYWQYSDVEEVWKNLVGTIDKVGLINNYDNSTFGKSEIYRPSLCDSISWNGDIYISFAYPSYSYDPPTSFYESKLIW